MNIMGEKLEIYDLNSDLINIEDRKKFYSEIKSEFKKKVKFLEKLKQ